MKQELTIRTATEDDAAALRKIYRPYVEKTAITFEYEVPELCEFRQRIRNILEKYPYLVAEMDGEIVGYAYLSAFHPRAAYQWCAETSIYVDTEKKKLGIGGKLYDALEAVAKEQGILNLNACIAVPEKEDEYLTLNSESFHEHLGYHMVGKFHNCGYKFGRWYHMVWMEKMIGTHEDKPKEVKPFSQVKENITVNYGIK